MSNTIPILSIGPSDPAYYADLLHNTTSLVDRRLRIPSDESCPTISDIKGIENKLTRRLQTLLDDIASISLCQRGNVSATMACLKHSHGTLKTRLYIVFDHQNDDSHRLCLQHLKSIFQMLKQVPYKTPETDGSPQLVTGDFKTKFFEICRVIHNYSFSIFAYRVYKRDVSNIRELIMKERLTFAPDQHSLLLSFLEAVELIIGIVSRAEKKETKLSIDAIEIIHGFYSLWKEDGLLPDDPLADSTVTLLDIADAVLARE